MARHVTLFLCGDVMTGRGIDQVLPHPGDPALHEPYVRDAGEYVRLAEAAHGAIGRAVGFAELWGDALDELVRAAPDVRIVNLETSMTRSDAAWPGKGVHYRMNPQNVPCLTAAKIDCCTLANNHVLDWGHDGLLETLDALHAAGLKPAGAGRNLEEAEAPAVVEIPVGQAFQPDATGRTAPNLARQAGKPDLRVLVFACGSQTSGIPADWAARPDCPGVNVVDESSASAVERLRDRIRETRRPGDVVVVSVHWGPNWGYGIPQIQRQFAHRMIDEAGADVIHGHSSHHVKGIEVWHEKLVLYGCGDFLTDYEGIGGYEVYRGDLGLMYFPSIEPATGRLASLKMTPTRVRRFRVTRAMPEEAALLHELLNREGADLGTRTDLDAEGRLGLRW